MSKVKRINILFLLPSLRRGGAETQAVDLVLGLDNNRFKKYLFTFHSVLEQRQRIDQNGVKWSNCPRQYKFDIRPILRIARLIDSEQIDVIHCTLQFSLLLGWMARQRSTRKPPLVTAIHTTVNRSIKEELQDKYIYRYLLRNCSKIVFVCETQRQHWLKKYKELADKSCTIYNGVDTSYFSRDAWVDAASDLRCQLDIPEKASIAACIAGFRPEKGHSVLLEAFSRLEGEPVLILAGDGEMRPDIERLVERKGLQGRVKMLGVVDDVRPLLTLVDVTVLASTAVETFSIAMLESMSMEVPVVATDIGGMAEAVVDGETGYVVPPADIDQLAITLSLVLENKENAGRMGRMAREGVLARFTQTAMCKWTQDVLEVTVQDAD